MNRQSPPPKRQTPTTQTKTQPLTEAERRAIQTRKQEALDALGRAYGCAINLGVPKVEIYRALCIPLPNEKPPSQAKNSLGNQMIGRFFVR